MPGSVWAGVVPEGRRRGYGRRVVEALEARCPEDVVAADVWQVPDTPLFRKGGGDSTYLGTGYGVSLPVPNSF